jgi:hypothetical protein
MTVPDCKVAKMDDWPLKIIKKWASPHPEVEAGPHFQHGNVRIR